MGKKIFISFDYEEDKQYRYLLQAWNKNEKFELDFSDHTPGEIQSDNIGRIKAVLTQKIRECNLVLGIVGKDANKLHSDSAKIGEINWQNWEIAQAVEEGKKIILVKIKKANKIFETARGKNTYIITGFTEEKIMKALNEITEGRNMDYWAGALLGAAGLAYLYNEYTKKNS